MVKILPNNWEYFCEISDYAASLYCSSFAGEVAFIDSRVGNCISWSIFFTKSLTTCIFSPTRVHFHASFWVYAHWRIPSTDDCAAFWMMIPTFSLIIAILATASVFDCLSDDSPATSDIIGHMRSCCSAGVSHQFRVDFAIHKKIRNIEQTYCTGFWENTSNFYFWY